MNKKKILKEIAFGVVILLILSNIISWLRQPKLTSEQLPQTTVRLLDGGSYALRSGKPVVIHFWATWCPVCRAEASNIDRLSQSYDVVTIAVNSGSDAALKAYMTEHHLHFKVLNDTDGSWAKQYDVEAFPTTFIYDAKGKLRFTEVGYTTTAGLLARLKLIE